MHCETITKGLKLFEKKFSIVRAIRASQILEKITKKVIFCS